MIPTWVFEVKAINRNKPEEVKITSNSIEGARSNILYQWRYNTGRPAYSEMGLPIVILNTESVEYIKFKGIM